MEISKILIILISSIVIYLTFLFLGFSLKNKNIKAQNLTKKEKWLMKFFNGTQKYIVDKKKL